MARVSSVAELFEKAHDIFKVGDADGLDATIQFDCTGAEPGTYHVVIKDKKLDVANGPAESPTMTITMDSADMVQMVNGEVNGMALFMMGKMKIAGDMQLALRLQQLLGLN